MLFSLGYFSQLLFSGGSAVPCGKDQHEINVPLLGFPVDTVFLMVACLFA